MVFLFPVILIHRLKKDLGTILLLSENLELIGPIFNLIVLATHVSILLIIIFIKRYHYP